MKKKLEVLLAVLFVLFLVWAWRDYDRRMNTYTCNTEPVKVYQGDTIWEIAVTNCWGNISYAVDELVDKYGTNIQIGQIIELRSRP